MMMGMMITSILMMIRVVKDEVNEGNVNEDDGYKDSDDDGDDNDGGGYNDNGQMR